MSSGMVVGVVGAALVSAFAVALPATRADPWRPPAGSTQIPLWPSGAPGVAASPADRETTGTVAKLVAGKPWTFVNDVSRPTLTFFPAKGANSGVTIVVFPGGGYQTLAIDLEGTEICDGFTSRGINCVLLKYRVPHAGPSFQSDCRCWINPKPAPALQDAQRALGIVRAHAAEWRIDPHKIGVIGFSAGGHLVAAISNDYVKRSYETVEDVADRESCRPDFAVAIYPGHLWERGTDPPELNPDIHVTSGTPPTFLLQAQDDRVDPPNHSLVYAAALKKAGVPVETHVFANGGHAFGLRRTKDPITRWPELVMTWLKTIGMMK